MLSYRSTYTLTVVGDGDGLVLQVGAIFHQDANEEAVHVHVKDHTRRPPTQRPTENGLRCAWQASRCQPGVYHFHRVGASGSVEWMRDIGVRR